MVNHCWRNRSRCAASIPFTRQRDVWAGIANETGLAKEQLEQVYAEKVAPAIEKWNTETKYQLHDNAKSSSKGN